MSLLEQIKFSENKLIAFYLGGNVEGFNIEIHDVVFVVTKTYEEAIDQLKSHWKGDQKSLHVDSWMVLEKFENYSIQVDNNENALKDVALYFVNTGYYLEKTFGEMHSIEFVVASSKSEARQIALERIKRKEHISLHMDNLIDIDECIKIENINDHVISIIEERNDIENLLINGWQRFPK